MEIIDKLQNLTSLLKINKDAKQTLIDVQTVFYDAGLSFIIDDTIKFYWLLSIKEFNANKIKLIKVFNELLMVITRKSFITKDIRLMPDKNIIFLNEYKKEEVENETIG